MSNPRLRTVDEAVALILDRARPLEPRLVDSPLTLGLILAEPIVADIDLPPFAKALMDGYAVRSGDFPTGGDYRRRVVDSIMAGRISDRAIEPGEVAQIMTGAPLPPGADSVINVERTQVSPNDPDHVTLTVPTGISPGQFVLPRGRELRQGDRLLGPGTKINAGMIGLIGSAGRGVVRVVPLPSVAVVSTGDELVPVERSPGPGQIRNTNGPMLTALANHWNDRVATELPTVPDRAEDLIASLRPTLETADVLIISGGVSAGIKDLVPAALLELGVEPVFHKVAVKPGKPICFGVGPQRSSGRPGTLVFGLPGNPASCVVGFLLFVRPALDALAGRGASPAPVEQARLGASFRHRGHRPTYHPARWRDGQLVPQDWAGSADLRTVALADGFAVFDAGDRDYAVGDEVGFLRLF